MAKGIITNAAGPTTGFFYDTGIPRDESISDTELVVSARILSGPFKGERATVTIIGRFDLETGVARVSEWRESVDGELHFSLKMDRMVPLDDHAAQRVPRAADAGRQPLRQRPRGRPHRRPAGRQRRRRQAQRAPRRRRPRRRLRRRPLRLSRHRRLDRRQARHHPRLRHRRRRHRPQGDRRRTRRRQPGVRLHRLGRLRRRRGRAPHRRRRQPAARRHRRRPRRPTSSSASSAGRTSASTTSSCRVGSRRSPESRSGDAVGKLPRNQGNGAAFRCGARACRTPLANPPAACLPARASPVTRRRAR